MTKSGVGGEERERERKRPQIVEDGSHAGTENVDCSKGPTVFFRFALTE